MEEFTVEDYYEIKKRIVKSDIKMVDDKLVKRKKMGKMNEKKVSQIEPTASNIPSHIRPLSKDTNSKR